MAHTLIRPQHSYRGCPYGTVESCGGRLPARTPCPSAPALHVALPRQCSGTHLLYCLCIPGTKQAIVLGGSGAEAPYLRREYPPHQVSFSGVPPQVLWVRQVMMLRRTNTAHVTPTFQCSCMQLVSFPFLRQRCCSFFVRHRPEACLVTSASLAPCVPPAVFPCCLAQL